MKSLFVKFLFIAGCAGANVKTLEEVYGVLPEIETMKPKSVGGRVRVASDLYRATRLPENCIFPLDIVIVQDATDSFTDDYVQMSTVQLPTMMSVLNETHPGSEFAVISFQDKPIVPFGIPPTPENGYYSDYCARINSPLTSNGTAIEEIYSSNRPNGGGDPPENQFHALLGATQAAGIQWSESPDRAQLLVVVTDAPPHFDADGSDPQGMRPSTGTYNEADVDNQCVTEFYPSPEQVKASIQARAAYTAFLVYDPEYMEGLVGRSWLWFNRFLGQTDEFITLQAQDSSNFWTNLASIIGIIEDIECMPATSTTVPPTTQTINGITSTSVATTQTINGITSTSVPTTEPARTITVSPIGTVEDTTAEPAPTPSEEPCPSCPPCPVPPCHCPCPPHPCPPKDCPEFTKICQDGVMIKLGQPVDELEVVVDGHEWDI